MRKLCDIAKEIRDDWTLINNGAAREALECMESIIDIGEPFATDPNGYGAVGSFLSNSMGWRGEKARTIKKELREMCGHPRP
jgi:hypothetical protein